VTPRPVHIIGVPLDLGQGRRGVDMGPSALRIAGIDQRIAALGHAVTDRGDLHVPIAETRAPGDRRRSTSGRSRASASACTMPCSAASATARCRSCSAAITVWVRVGRRCVDWAQQRGLPIGLLWVDAHGDMNTPA